MFHPIIHTHNGSSWFSGLMIFTLLLVNGVFIFKGLKQKRPLDSLLLITAAGVLFFLIGISLFPLSGQNILEAIKHGTSTQLGEKSVIGGLLGLIARMLVILILRERMKLIDNIAVVFLIGLGLQNLGCFMAGCCYGELSSGIWTVQYGSGSPAFMSQVQSGILEPGAMHSLAIYPVQLFLLVACLVAAFLAWKRQDQWKAPMSAFLFSMILYLVARFTVEFFRDPSTNHGSGMIIMGIKQIHWILLSLLAFFTLLLIWRERSWNERFYSEGSGNRMHLKIALGIMLVLINWWMRGLFEFAGRLVIDITLLSAFMAMAWNVFKHFTLPAYRAATVVSLFGACLLMSQNYIPQNKEEKTTYTEIGGGIQFSKFYNTISTNLGQSSGCSGNYYATGNPHEVKYNSLIAGGSWSKTEILGLYKRAHYGLNFYAGNDWEKGIDTSYNKSVPIFGAEPFVGFDGRWVGFSAGLHLGNFHYADLLTKSDNSNVGKIVGDVKNQYVFPSLSFRVGPYDLFYLETTLANHFPSPSPVMFSGVALGTGLGKTDGRTIKLGSSTAGYFAQAYYPIKENYFINTSIGYRNKGQYDDNASRTLISLGLLYRFNYKTIQRKYVKKSEPQPIP
ncbi:MAG: prolipoprotein diacylglyceryl transferase [Bacteroidetes bacterium]|nr:prolipoprotein diacylglyceryl transferase [Bacteroidota bacterium]